MGMHERWSGEETRTTSTFDRSYHRCRMETATKPRLRASIGDSDRVDWTLLAHCRSACAGPNRKLRLCRW